MKVYRKDQNTMDYKSINMLLAPRPNGFWAEGKAEGISTNRFLPKIVLLKQLWLCSLQNYIRNHHIMPHRWENLSLSSRGEP
jgi:hypothetical protein